MADRYTFRAGPADDWSDANPILAAGEPAWDLDNGIGKVGDGATPYNSLPVAFSIAGASYIGPSIDDDDTDGDAGTVWSSSYVRQQLAAFLQQAQQYTDQFGQSAQLVVVDQASDGTWASRPNSAVVYARGYSLRTDPPSWLTTADEYKMRS